jgi:uncharacterized membrane protein
MFNLTCKGNEEFSCVFWYFPVCSTETNMEIPCVHEKTVREMRHAQRNLGFQYVVICMSLSFTTTIFLV